MPTIKHILLQDMIESKIQNAQHIWWSLAHLGVETLCVSDEMALTKGDLTAKNCVWNALCVMLEFALHSSVLLLLYLYYCLKLSQYNIIWLTQTLQLISSSCRTVFGMCGWRLNMLCLMFTLVKKLDHSAVQLNKES